MTTCASRSRCAPAASPRPTPSAAPDQRDRRADQAQTQPTRYTRPRWPLRPGRATPSSGLRRRERGLRPGLDVDQGRCRHNGRRPGPRRSDHPVRPQSRAPRAPRRRRGVLRPARHRRLHLQRRPLPRRGRRVRLPATRPTAHVPSASATLPPGFSCSCSPLASNRCSARPTRRVSTRSSPRTASRPSAHPSAPESSMRLRRLS